VKQFQLFSEMSEFQIGHMKNLRIPRLQIAP
jgi:hypothetical protein